MDSWLRLLQAAASQDRDACIQWSLKLGYLTGEENEVHTIPSFTRKHIIILDYAGRTCGLDDASCDAL